MIGLLRKDQTLLWTTYNKNFLVVLLCYTAMIFASDSLIFVMYALIFLGGLYVSSTLTLDEQSQWDTYARTLPVTAAQIVGSKYLLSASCCPNRSARSAGWLAGTWPTSGTTIWPATWPPPPWSSSITP